ncbi:GH11238 [Drosophila grimshawi]|uniref:GH11238 n=1 Tax=Drosophila grimshawi TaxID=7222 RepID=B4JDS4_DROGR|nr:GH11238 [Drosophila grimshawi]
MPPASLSITYALLLTPSLCDRLAPTCSAKSRANNDEQLAKYLVFSLDGGDL